MKSPQKKAQVWYIDYMVATFIFVVAILLYFEVTSNLSREEEGNLNEMTLDAATITSAILSEGHPDNWTVGNVKRIGVISNNRLDYKKLNELNKIDYTTSAYLFGTTYDYHVVFTDRNDNTRYIAKSCGYGSPTVTLSLNSTDPIAYFRRTTGDHTMSELSPVHIYDETNQTGLAKKLKDYDLVVLEDAQWPLELADNLSEYVLSGGIVIASEKVIANDSYYLWGIKFTNRTCTNATVIAEDEFINLTIGENIEFEDCQSTSQGSAIANFTNTTSGITIIEYGSGKSYYFSDFNASADSQAISEVVLTLAGYYKTGVCETLDPLTLNVDDMVKTTRFLVDKNRMLKMEVFIWN